MNPVAVSLIVPLRGSDPELEPSLRSLLEQDYPDYEILLITDEAEDPAAAIIGRLLADSSRHASRSIRHIVAGPAQRGGQKNYNLLAGVRAAEPSRALLVFCDGGHWMPPDWLGKLVTPLIEGRAEVSTGYHDMLVPPGNTASAAQALCVLFLKALQHVPALAQPWGGSMAMTRNFYRRVHLEEYWSRQIVDDVSLARLLKSAGTRVHYVSAAMVKTPGGSTSWSDFPAWLYRQLFFLKIYFPLTWAAGGAIGYAAALGLVACLVAGVMKTPAYLAGPAIFTVLGAGLRRGHPSPGTWGAWLAGGWMALGAACISHARTLFSRQLTWRGIAYRVSRQGEVSRLPEA